MGYRVDRGYGATLASNANDYLETSSREYSLNGEIRLEQTDAAKAIHVMLVDLQQK